RQQQLRLIRDRRVHAPGGEQLQRFRRVGGGLGLYVQARRAEVAVGDRRIQRGVVGIGEEVEHHREALRRGGREGVLLGPARRQRERRQQSRRPQHRR